MKKTAIIMAGGSGERFWPLSRKKLPKQFLSVVDDGRTMIQLTVDRLLPMIKLEDMFIVTNKNYVELVKAQLPGVPAENILAEPLARDTAAAIGFASAIIEKKYGDAVTMVLASDHLIKNDEIYLDTMELACQIAGDNDNLVTIGITPTYPETGYGYINFHKGRAPYTGAYEVMRFVEKPTLDKAKEYLADGAYLWNSGMFVWKISTIMGKFKALEPDMHTELLKIAAAFGTPEYDDILLQSFESFGKISVDYAIMEKSEDIYTIPGNFGWDDVGNWLAISRINKTNEFGNFVQGEAICLDTKNTTIMGGRRMIATIGLEDIVIVDTEDALLICDKDHTQDIKKIIEHLKIGNHDEIL